MPPPAGHGEPLPGRLRQRRRKLSASLGEARRWARGRPGVQRGQVSAGTRRPDARVAPSGSPGAEEGSWGVPLGSLARSAAGMETAVFLPVPPLAGEDRCLCSFLMGLLLPPLISLLLTTRGSLSRPAHLIHSSVSGSPCTFLLPAARRYPSASLPSPTPKPTWYSRALPQPHCRRPQVGPSSLLSQTRFSLPYSSVALRFCSDLPKSEIYPSGPYPFANTVRAGPRVSSEPISSRVLHRLGSLLPPLAFHSPAPPRAALHSDSSPPHPPPLASL